MDRIIIYFFVSIILGCNSNTDIEVNQSNQDLTVEYLQLYQEKLITELSFEATLTNDSILRNSLSRKLEKVMVVRKNTMRITSNLSRMDKSETQKQLREHRSLCMTYLNDQCPYTEPGIPNLNVLYSQKEVVEYLVLMNEYFLRCYLA